MYTVLSAFDAPDAAERALDLLAQEGFPRQNMHIEVNADMDRALDRITDRVLASPERETAVGPLALSAVDHFFDRLLGRSEHSGHARTYGEAVRRGGAVLVVDTSSEITAERAATVMHESGAYEIADRTAHVIDRPSEPPLAEIWEQRHKSEA